MKQIATIPKIIFRNEIERVFGVGEGRREIAAYALTSRRFNCFNTVIKDGLFLRGRKAVRVARIINAVGKKLPIALHTVFDDFGVMITKRDIQAHGAAQIMTI